MRPVHWIETELSRHYEDLDLSRGVDLDHNGAIEGSERTDRNGDGNVDSAEWQKFTGDNRAALEKLGGHFKAYYSAGTAFKPDNPIHDLLSIESELASPDEVKKAYEKVRRILSEIRQNLYLIHQAEPEEKLRHIYYNMEWMKIKFEEQPDETSFVSDINKGALNKGILDCDTSSYVVLAIAHEMNWPVHLVKAPRHMFVRWDDGEGTKFNMDYGKIRSDQYYISEYDIHWASVRGGVYLKNLNYQEMLSLFYKIRGNVNMEHSRLQWRIQDAIKDYDRALEFDPKNKGAKNNKSAAIYQLSKFEPINSPSSCICNAPGQTGHSQASDRSLLSLVIMLFE